MIALTERDIRLVRDIALSHLLSRDQVLRLGYFGSVTRCNTRLRELAAESYIRKLTTSFQSQGLYTVGRKARSIVGDRIAQIIDRRLPTPRFVQHALAVTDLRLALLEKFGGEWRFEQQSRVRFLHGHLYEIRPDGVLLTQNLPILVEADQGHVCQGKFSAKLASYKAFVDSRQCERIYGTPTFRLLTQTTSRTRAHNLRKLLPLQAGFEFLVLTNEELGTPVIQSWS